MVKWRSTSQLTLRSLMTAQLRIRDQSTALTMRDKSLTTAISIQERHRCWTGSDDRIYRRSTIIFIYHLTPPHLHPPLSTQTSPSISSSKLPSNIQLHFCKYAQPKLCTPIHPSIHHIIISPDRIVIRYSHQQCHAFSLCAHNSQSTQGKNSKKKIKVAEARKLQCKRATTSFFFKV